MSAGLTGVLLGLTAATGLVLLLAYAPPARPVRLVDRLAPYVQDTPPPSRLLGTATQPGLLSAARRVFGPALGDGARFVDRLLGGRVAVRRRLDALAAESTVEDFRVEQVVWGAVGLVAGLASGAGWLDYLFALWADVPAIKLAQPLTSVGAAPALAGPEVRADVIRRLAEQPVLLPVTFGRDIYRMPYTGLNAGIERDQTRGDFFEAAELHYLLRRIGTGKRIVDVGANTGNHTVFFAGPMQAASVIPFEPLPDVAAILRRSVEANGLGHVDMSQLCVGLSDAPGHAGVVRSERGGLGASRLVDDPDGEIPVMRLDDALTEAVDFLKIDVESMEMRVLAGAAGIIARDRPVIFIEIANEDTTAFVEWLTQGNYRVERIFSDKGHSNYLIAPSGD